MKSAPPVCQTPLAEKAAKKESEANPAPAPAPGAAGQGPLNIML